MPDTVQSLSQIAATYDTDKAGNPSYLRDFEQLLETWRDREFVLLELGIFRGGSLRMWRDYFPRARVVGLDLQAVVVDDPTGRIAVYQGSQDDTHLLDRIRAETAPDGFDLVIDDCSHLAGPSRISFWHLLDNHLRPGGLYCIEDWGTGYWDGWPDGRHIGRPGSSMRPRAGRWLASQESAGLAQRVPGLPRVLRRLGRLLGSTRFPSHDHGMVGFVKELVDEVGIGDSTDATRGTGEGRLPRFVDLRFSPGHVFVFKRPQPRPDAT